MRKSVVELVIRLRQILFAIVDGPTIHNHVTVRPIFKIHFIFESTYFNNKVSRLNPIHSSSHINYLLIQLLKSVFSLETLSVYIFTENVFKGFQIDIRTVIVSWLFKSRILKNMNLFYVVWSATCNQHIFAKEGQVILFRKSNIKEARKLLVFQNSSLHKVVNMLEEMIIS